MFASTFALIAAVAVRQVATGESLPTFVFGLPAVLGVAGVIGVIAYNLAASTANPPTVSYYGQKLGAAMIAFSFVGLALLFADAVSTFAPRMRASRSRSRVLLVGLAAVLTCVAVFQIDGYVGPGTTTVALNQSAVGFQTHQLWTHFDHSLDPVGNSFLDAADNTRVRAKESGVYPEQWSYIDIEGLDPGRPDWTDLWFSALVGDLTSPRLARAYSLYTLNGVTDPTAAATSLTQLFPPSGGAVRLVVPDSLIQPLVQNGWTLGTNVFPRSAPT